MSPRRSLARDRVVAETDFIAQYVAEVRARADDQDRRASPAAGVYYPRFTEAHAGAHAIQLSCAHFPP